jgi:hypothetical protein
VHPRLSGAVLLDQVRVIESVVSRETLQRAIATMDPSEQAELAALIPLSWCRIETSERLIHAVANEVNRAPLEFHAEVARIGVERTMRGMWRVLLRLTTDDALVRRTPLLFSKTFDRGEMTTRVIEKGHAECRVTGWPEITPMQVQGIGIGVQTVLTVAGRKDVRVARERTPTGALYQATWRA